MDYLMSPQMFLSSRTTKEESKMLLRLALALVLSLFFVAKAQATSPFDGRNLDACQDFYVTHKGTIKNIHEIPGDAGRIFVVSAPEPYFNWPTLVIKTNRPRYKTAKIDDELLLNFKHTTSDVPRTESSVTESFFDSLTDFEPEYLGFLLHKAARVKSIKLEPVESEGEIGRFTVYWVNFVFDDETTARVWEKAGEIDVLKVAQPGDEVLIATGRSIQQINYQSNPYGNNKTVYQKHFTGPDNNEKIYLKPTYGDQLFNITQKTSHRFN